VSYAKTDGNDAGAETDAAKLGNARPSSCKHIGAGESTAKVLNGVTRKDGSSDYNCHRCDTEFECQQRQINRVIEIVHDKRFSHVGYNKNEASKFHCKIIDGAARAAPGADDARKRAYWRESLTTGTGSEPASPTWNAQNPRNEVSHMTTIDGHSFRTSMKHRLTETESSCQCRCTHHPMGCFRKNWKFAGDLRQGSHKYIHGNIYQGIASKETCSNLCSHHPECKLWEFDSTGTCILRTNSAAETQYTQNLDTSITTYAGVSSHNSAQCLTHDRPTLCPYGKYVWTEQSTEKKYCLNCAAGKYTRNGNNADQCYDKSELEAQLGGPGHAFVYPDETAPYQAAEAMPHNQHLDNHDNATGALHDGLQRRR